MSTMTGTKSTRSASSPGSATGRLEARHGAALVDAYGILGVVSRVLRAGAYVVFDYTTWVCAAFTWLNTSALARPLTDGAHVGLGRAYALAGVAFLVSWAVRGAFWSVGSQWAVPPSVAELLAPRAPDLDITLDGVAPAGGKE